MGYARKVSIMQIQDAEFRTVENNANNETALIIPSAQPEPNVQTITLRDRQTKETRKAETVIGERFWNRQVKGFKSISEGAGRSIEDSFAESGMDWETGKEEMYLQDGSPVQNNYAIRRKDTGKVLGICGDVWKPISNAAKFSLLAPYLENDQARIVGVGEINGGEKVTVILQLAGAIAEIRKGDEIGSFLTVTDHFNGRQGLKVNLFSLRLICTNGTTQQTSLGKIQVKHSKHGEKRLESRLTGLEGVRLQIEDTTEKMKLLASRPVPNSAKALEYVTETMGFNLKIENGKAVLPTRSENTALAIMGSFESTKYGLGQGSWYDLLQAVAEYRTHRQGQTPETRIDSLLHGPGAIASSRDFELALEMSA